MGKIKVPTINYKRVIKTNSKGDIRHILKKTDHEFITFGEIYLSEVVAGETKGWKLHKETSLNLHIINGAVTFWILNYEKTERFKFHLECINNAGIHIPNRHWVAFGSEKGKDALIMSLIEDPHVAEESINCDLESIPLW